MSAGIWQSRGNLLNWPPIGPPASASAHHTACRGSATHRPARASWGVDAMGFSSARGGKVGRCRVATSGCVAEDGSANAARAICEWREWESDERMGARSMDSRREQCRQIEGGRRALRPLWEVISTLAVRCRGNHLLITTKQEGKCANAESADAEPVERTVEVTPSRSSRRETPPIETEAYETVLSAASRTIVVAKTLRRLQSLPRRIDDFSGSRIGESDLVGEVDIVLNLDECIGKTSLGGSVAGPRVAALARQYRTRREPPSLHDTSIGDARLPRHEWPTASAFENKVVATGDGLADGEGGAPWPMVRRGAPRELGRAGAKGGGAGRRLTPPSTKRGRRTARV